MEGFSPSRLDLARRRRGLTKTALADAAGVSTRILTAYERGDRVPSEMTVQRFAAVLDFPVEFLTGDDIEEPSIDGVSFRALSAMTARQRDQATGAATITPRAAGAFQKRVPAELSRNMLGHCAFRYARSGSCAILLI